MSMKRNFKEELKKLRRTQKHRINKQIKLKNKLKICIKLKFKMIKKREGDKKNKNKVENYKIMCII